MFGTRLHFQAILGTVCRPCPGRVLATAVSGTGCGHMKAALSVVHVKDAGTRRQQRLVTASDATLCCTSVFVPPHLGIEKKSCFNDHGCSSLSAFPDRENFDWEERKGRDESERQRAESQRIVAARLLCRLQYPVAYLSRLQRILPAARWKLYFKVANAARLSTGPPTVCTGRLIPSVDDALLALTGRVVPPTLLL
ncbi:Probable glucuronoxylan glucuronosyltransferase F8H [Olea europaea subsp. europaea]|uniref:Probable glucuronoxylan glucuronosyltransferase F8H n=1 Tax=Olea europaea subsp. europaea TaxID=158383 RepID=A0A8S0PF12_OLEEU|nr:Probable glucuronoxylan glucuronosyltransferase F8H [Olea europaea subsp. europaea]